MVKQCVASNVQSIILRPHNLFGPRMGMKHVIPQLIKNPKYKKDGSLSIFLCIKEHLLH